MMKTSIAPNQPLPLWENILRACPQEIKRKILDLSTGTLNSIEEIRFRRGQPLQFCGDGVDAFLHRDGGLTADANLAVMVSEDLLSRVLQVVTQSSLYAVEDELRRGFVTMPGGHRVGIAGRAVLYESGSVRSIRSISSVNIRIAKERLGAGHSVAQYLYRKSDGAPYSTLIISPPQCGKTTLIRDLARLWSEGAVVPGGRGLKVSVVDERSEITGCVDGVPQFRLGPRLDVLDACPKAEGMLMMIRSMSPDIVVTDEIGREQDRDAILEATHAGVAVLTTAHASSLDEWRNRPFMAELFKARSFERYILLSRKSGPGTVEQVLDKDGIPILYSSSRKQVTP